MTEPSGTAPTVPTVQTVQTTSTTPTSASARPTRRWHGVLVATALPLRPAGGDHLGVDLDGYAEHVAWLAAAGCHGVAPNGSLGEYQTLTAAERAAVVRTALAAAPAGFTVMPGGRLLRRPGGAWLGRAGR